jgi:hypothetical protein
MLRHVGVVGAIFWLTGCQEDPNTTVGPRSESSTNAEATLVGSAPTAPQVTAVWNDYFDQLRTAVVNLPSAYHETPTLFRTRRDQEPADSYLRAAVAELSRVSHLRIPAGHYEIPVGASENQGTVLNLINVSNKILDFSQSTISLYEPRTLFFIKNAERFALRNVRVVHRYPLASVGLIDMRGGMAIPRLTPEYTTRLKNFPPAFNKISAIYQAHPAILSGQAPYMWRKEGSSFRLIDENLLSAGITGWSPQTGLYQIQPGHELLRETARLGGEGTRLLVKHRSYGANGIVVQSGSDFTFEGIKINGVGGMGFYISDVPTGILIRNCVIRSNKEEDPLALFGATVDGIHLARVGENVIIQDNFIADTGDDGINVYHGNIFQIEGGNAAEIIVRRMGGGAMQSLQPNTLASFYSDNLQLKKDAVLITGVRTLPAVNGQQRFALTHDSGYNGFVGNSDFMTIGKPTTGRVFIANNTIRNSTARGVLVQAKDVMVKSNIFENIARSAIKITSDTRWFYEYGLPQNIKLFDNTITNAAWDHLDVDPWSTAPAAITALVEIVPTTRGDKKPYGLTGAIKNLSVIQNRVSDVPTSLGHFGVANIRIFSNIFSAHPPTLTSKRPGSAHGWFITGSVFGENAQSCQANQAADCGH